jgi:hypothetical protein
VVCIGIKHCPWPRISPKTALKIHHHDDDDDDDDNDDDDGEVIR